MKQLILNVQIIKYAACAINVNSGDDDEPPGG